MHLCTVGTSLSASCSFIGSIGSESSSWPVGRIVTWMQWGRWWEVTKHRRPLLNSRVWSCNKSRETGALHSSSVYVWPPLKELVDELREEAVNDPLRFRCPGSLSVESLSLRDRFLNRSLSSALISPSSSSPLSIMGYTLAIVGGSYTYWWPGWRFSGTAWIPLVPDSTTSTGNLQRFCTRTRGTGSLETTR